MSTVVRVTDGKIETVRYVRNQSKRCWHCVCQLDDPASTIPYPKSYDEKRKTFEVFGAFCSFACVGGYSRDRGRLCPGGQSGIAIFELYKQSTGSTRPPPIAPPRELLDEFGGHLDIDQFRNLSGTERDIVSVPTNLYYKSTSYHDRAAQISSTEIRRTANAFVDTETATRHRMVEPVSKTKTVLEIALGL